jgi:glycosyltransferase involved in cell wall biosynthesis
MNILFLSISKIKKISERGIYTDLIREFRNRGNNVYVVSPRERRYKKRTEFSNEEGINILRIKTGNITKINLIEKGISTLLIEKQFLYGIKKYFNNIVFDLIIYSTPPVTFEKIVQYVKERDNARSYLILKDIFPQNAVDLGLLKKGGLIYRHFRKKEINLYKLSDFIGCMSQANVDYIIRNNPFLEQFNIEVCPNSIEPIDNVVIEKKEKNKIRENYCIPKDTIVLIYGGNLGKPQCIDFLIKILKSNKNREDIYFLIIGSGTEYLKLKNHIDKNGYMNAKLYPYLPKEEYDELVPACDVGLILLDPRFTIPNFPSRLLTYMEFSMPVIAATDVNTDLGKIIMEGEFGYWCECGDINGFNKILGKLCTNSQLLLWMGKKARDYFDRNYIISKAYDIIVNHFK